MRQDHRKIKKKISQKLDFFRKSDYNYRKEVGKLWGYGFGFLLFGL
jgi:regulation of enolase protein 1 (concanavalin A-like superfamily)